MGWSIPSRVIPQDGEWVIGAYRDEPLTHIEVVKIVEGKWLDRRNKPVDKPIAWQHLPKL